MGLARALAHHGVLGTAKLAYTRLVAPPAAPSAFDQHYGVDTDEIRRLKDCQIDAPAETIKHGTRYQASGIESFHAALALIPEPLDGFTFVDIGAGKGRALLLAEQYPFRRIVGVEFAIDLCLIARVNLDRMGSRAEMHCADATRFDLPSGPLLLYLYNPFNGPIMRAFVQHVLTTVRNRCLVVYRNPVCAEAWSDPRIEVLARDTSCVVYDIARKDEQPT